MKVPPTLARTASRYSPSLPTTRCARGREGKSNTALAMRSHPRQRHEATGSARTTAFCPQRMIPKSAVAVFGQDHAPRTRGGRAPTGAWSRGRISGCGSGLSAARSPLGAPPRRLPRKSMPWLSPGRVSWDLRRAGYCPPSAVPVQRGTSRTGRVAGRSDARTARARGYEPRPQEPHPLRRSAVTGDVPDERDGFSF